MSKKNIPVAFIALGLILAAFSLSSVFLDNSDELAALKPPSQGSPMSLDPTPTPIASGPFSLTDHNGKSATDTDFQDKFMLIFFGYTYCPDVCPTELQAISDAMDILGDISLKVQPIFVSVDPERDTPEVLANYVKAFHPRLIGLTGSAQQIAEIAKLYKTNYIKLESSTAEPDEYLMGHTSSIYLIAPGGRPLFTFPHGIGPEELAKEIGKFLIQEKSS